MKNEFKIERGDIHLRPLALREASLIDGLYGMVYADTRQRQVAISGALTTGAYKAVRLSLEAMTGDQGITISINSPGGYVTGLYDLCDYIQTRRNVTCMVEGMACSAAYAIAASCSEILIGRSATLGSIGIVAMHVDQTGLDAKLGLKFTPVFAGGQKVNGNPHLPLSPQAYASLKADVDQEYNTLCSTVAAGRGMAVRAIKNTQAATYLGDKAVAAGLADQVVSFPYTPVADSNGPQRAAATSSGPKDFMAAWKAIKASEGCDARTAMSKAARQYPGLYEAHAAGAQPNTSQANVATTQPDSFTAAWQTIKAEEGCNARTAMSKAARQYPALYEAHASGRSERPTPQDLPRPTPQDLPRPGLKDLPHDDQVKACVAMIQADDSMATWSRINKIGGIPLVKDVARIIRQ
ncbi:S49 family peptidase [uncultured Desulfobacter sp.]|uniref:S49 family peptidase n=1 Tax=uncultured Desulfobacter sp. TaxID=240139 RepID=UPI002AA6D661|nr:S49 family peptidase [uncultured Desulfobacter sp.]